MNSKEYAAKKQRVAGGIKALVDTNVPCAVGCAAHPIQAQTSKLLADGMALDAEFWGNGGIEELADKTAEKVLERVPGPNKSEWSKKMPLPGGRQFDWTEARIWRVVLAALIALGSLLARGSREVPQDVWGFPVSVVAPSREADQLAQMSNMVAAAQARLASNYWGRVEQKRRGD